ncbi:hypothetical protein ACV345_23405 [Pseudomonas aeruginosa]
MSSTQHQLIEQCATRLRGIVEALDNIHDNTPHRWSTDLDDVHSSAESLLAMIKDQAPTPCIDCKGTGFCNSISGEEIRCPCHAPIQFADPAQTPVEQFEQAPPSEDQLTAAGLSYPLAKEDAVKLWYAGFRSEVVTVLEAWEAIGHDIGMNPSKGELLDSLRYMLEKCEAHDDALARAAELEKELAMTRDAASKGDAARHAAGGMEMEIQELKAKLAEQAQHSAPEVFGLERYRVERTGQGFWPYCVRAGDGTRELFVGHLKQCKRVAAQLATAFEDGKFIARLPTVQAQHSVPEISGIGRDAEHPRAVVLYLRNEPSEEDMRAIQNFLRAISADVLTQAQHSAGYAEARQCVNCRHIGINDAADYAACHDCRWTGPEPDEDKCPGCAGENCMAAACPECGGRYELVAEAKISTPAAQAGQVPQAWLDVQAERRRQVEAEGWTPEHDDAHSHGQMARAAACYALAGSSAPNDGTAALLVSLAWPWDEQWWKPTSARRDLVKACALGLAEIERLDRAAASQGGPSDA